jgi:hypothetical protein
MRHVGSLLRFLCVSPAAVVGALVAALALCTGATLRRVDGTFEVAGGCLPRAPRAFARRSRFVAITLGHVIVGIDHDALARASAHERIHVRQYERLGVFFFPLYAASSCVQLLRGRDPYLDNAFEREAFASTES